MLNIHLVIGLAICILSIILGYRIGKRDGEIESKVKFLTLLDILDDSGELIKQVRDLFAKANDLSPEVFNEKAMRYYREIKKDE